jgi:hypothetical protein
MIGMSKAIQITCILQFAHLHLGLGMMQNMVHEQLYEAVGT